MTEQYNQPTEQLDTIGRLNYQLEAVQALHAEALRDLQENEGKLIDRTAYHARHKLLTEAHEEASKRIAKRIEETQATTRRDLALSLRYEGNTETERASWAQAVRMVEDANTIEKQEALVHRALRWGDKALARALVFKFGGQPEYKAMHEVLSSVDDRIKATFDYERKHGTYKKKGADRQIWAGWQTYGKGELPDIPGRPAHLQPGYLREQRIQRLAQLKQGK